MQKVPKKFFWIKLKDNFFKQLAIKKLRKVAGGDTFVIIYLKMMLLSMNNEGKIAYKCYDDSEFVENLALELDEDLNNVQMTIVFLKTQKLIDFTTEGEAVLPEAIDCIGSESEWAEKKRRYRENKALPQGKEEDSARTLSSDNSSNVRQEIRDKSIEKDIEIDSKRENIKREKKTTPTQKTNYASSVKLSNKEYADLVGQYGDNAVAQMIEILNNYKESTGKKYKSDAAAIRSWVIDAYLERSNKSIKPTTNVAEAQQELARRVGDDGNDDDTNHSSSVWGVWGK